MTEHFCGDRRPGPCASRPASAPSRLAAALGDVGLQVVAHLYLGQVYHSLGDYRQAVECLAKNVACLHGALLQERFGLPGLASVFSRSHLVRCLAECGRLRRGAGPRRRRGADCRGGRSPLQPESWHAMASASLPPPGGPAPGHPVARTGLELCRVCGPPLLFYRRRLDPWARRMPSPDGSPRPCRCWSRRSSRPCEA